VTTTGRRYHTQGLITTPRARSPWSVPVEIPTAFIRGRATVWSGDKHCSGNISLTGTGQGPGNGAELNFLVSTVNHRVGTITLTGRASPCTGAANSGVPSISNETSLVAGSRNHHTPSRRELFRLPHCRLAPIGSAATAECLFRKYHHQCRLRWRSLTHHPNSGNLAVACNLTVRDPTSSAAMYGLRVAVLGLTNPNWPDLLPATITIGTTQHRTYFGSRASTRSAATNVNLTTRRQYERRFQS